MNWQAHCGVVIPCLNEAAHVGPLVASLKKSFATVIVVNDGSRDETGAVATAAGAVLLNHQHPCGKGAALRTGLHWLHQAGFPWALLMDGDGQHCVADIPSFFRRQEATGAAMVIGNRMLDAARMPWLRRQVNRWMSARLSARAGRRLPDSQCGFRLLNVALWARLDLQTTHFEIESETLMSFVASGAPVEFVPIRVIYGGERTKISPVTDTWRWMRWWLKRKTELAGVSQRPIVANATDANRVIANNFCNLEMRRPS